MVGKHILLCTFCQRGLLKKAKGNLFSSKLQPLRANLVNRSGCIIDVSMIMKCDNYSSDGGSNDDNKWMNAEDDDDDDDDDDADDDNMRAS